MSIFPIIPDFDYLVDNTMEIKDNTKIGRSFKFDFKNKRFIVSEGQVKETTELEALEQWIELCLYTYKDKYNVYKSTDFCCNIEDIVGKRLNNFYIIELKREVKQALLKNNMIQKVNKIDIMQERKSAIINIIVELKNKQILEKEVTI